MKDIKISNSGYVPEPSSPSLRGIGASALASLSRTRSLLKRTGKGLAIAAMTLAANQAYAFNSNWIFETTPIDMDLYVEGIQWLRGASNPLEVRMTVGADMPSNIKISAISFVMNDADGTAGTDYYLTLAKLPDAGDDRDIFFGKNMFENTLSTSFSVPNSRVVNAPGDRVDATKFVSVPGLYGVWEEYVSNNVALGNSTNVAKTLGTFAITVNNGTTSYNIPVGQIVRAPTPSYQLVDALSAPELSSTVLFGLGAGALALSRRKRTLDSKINGSQIPNNHNNRRMYSRRS